jgi:uncharacterized RmlC-like cupin family protein
VAGVATFGTCTVILGAGESLQFTATATGASDAFSDTVTMAAGAVTKVIIDADLTTTYVINTDITLTAKTYDKNDL